MRFLLLVLLSGLISVQLYSQNTAIIKGTVSGKESRMTLPGANVFLVGTDTGSKTTSRGEYSIRNLSPGKYQVRATYVGYAPQTIEIELIAGEEQVVNFFLDEMRIESKAINVIASRAEFRETPIAFSNIEKSDLEMRLGSRDLPMLLAETPGVYATEGGGGSGDARINIRGFDQRNISVMVNGVPVNDMETGWVYWANWDGLADVTTSVQVQRGLGAAKIANPSVGGTMNIITDAADQKAGISYKQEFGNDIYRKYSLVANTGKLGDFAFTFSGARETGDGWAQRLYNDAWSYYFAASWDINKNNYLDFYVMGAPQQHGQRNWLVNTATYSHELAREVGFTEAELAEIPERGREFNQHWGPVDFKGDAPKEYYLGAEHEARYDDGILESNNFYHKPQMNINWFWQINNKVSLTNVAYASIGNGGGSGYFGSFPGTTEDGYRNFQLVYDRNSINVDPTKPELGKRSTTILRNSINSHTWYGYIGTVDYKPTNDLRFQFGADIRSYLGEHYREVRNLIGGDYFVDEYRGEPNDPTDTSIDKLGDKIDYHNEGKVTWFGGFMQAEYTYDDVTAYLNTTLSNTQYIRKDYFKFNPETGADDWETDPENFLGYTIKGGANLNVNENVNVYANTGYYSRAPFFNNVFSFENRVFDDVRNEKVMAFELGSGYRDRAFTANLDLYYTYWIDKAYTSNFPDTIANETYFVNVPGINAVHMGMELALSYRLVDFMRLRGVASIGDWQWEGNANARIQNAAGEVVQDIRVYADGLKVGDAAQTQLNLGATFFPVKNSYLAINYNAFMNHWADFLPDMRQNPDDTAQPWKLPNFFNINLHAGYTFWFNDYVEGFPVSLKIFTNMFNITDELYIWDADDEAIYGRSNSFTRPDYNPRTYVGEHNAQNAEVNLGRPFTWTFGFELRY